MKFKTLFVPEYFFQLVKELSRPVYGNGDNAAMGIDNVIGTALEIQVYSDIRTKEDSEDLGKALVRLQIANRKTFVVPLPLGCLVWAAMKIVKGHKLTPEELLCQAYTLPVRTVEQRNGLEEILDDTLFFGNKAYNLLDGLEATAPKSNRTRGLG